MSVAPAAAAPDSNPLSATVNHIAWANGKPVPGVEVKPGEVLNPGADLMLAVGYGPQEGQTWSDLAGKSFEISVGGPVAGLNPVLSDNDAIASFEVSKTDPTKYVITFADKIAADTVDGYVFLTFKAQSEKNSSTEPISWDLGTSNTGQVEVTVKGTESKPAPTKNEQSKSVNNAKPDLFDVDQSAGNKTPSERISIKPGALDTEFTYTLNVTSLTADAAYPIVDELPVGLVLVPGSFSVSQTRWESASSDSPITVPGVTFDPTVTAAGFEGTLDVPAFSVTTITYKLKIKDQATLDGWYQDFLAKVAADENFETGKNVDIASLKNTASFGPGAVEKSATVNIKDGWGNMAEVGPDGAFGKSASPSYSIPVLNEDGTLAAPVAVEFTLNANLNSWDGSTNLKPKLKENVVITDQLSTNYTWAPQDAGFISATGIRANDATGTGAAQLTLSEATGFSGTAADFASDAYVGKWYVDAASNTLYVNVGKSQYTNASIKVATQLVNVKGLTADGNKANTPGNVTGTEYFHAKNTASFTYTDKKGNPASKDKTAENTVVNQDEQPEGAHDENRFSKSLGTDKVSVKSGEAAVVPFAVEAKGIKGFDPSKTTIVDYVDTNMFDLRDEVAAAAAIKTSLKANYNGSALKAEDFEVEVSAAAGTVTLKYTGAVSATGKDLRVEFPLSTYPVYGKQVLDITNKAVLFGEDGQADYWDDTTTTATNYGFEAQVKKTLYNAANKELTDILQPETVNGEYVQKTYVYRVQIIPHGGYQGVKMRTLIDHLPVGTEFVGFIADEDMDTAANAKGQDGTPYALKQGNLEAVFSANPDATVESTPGDVVLRQKAGTTFPANTDAVWLNLAVKITSKKNGVPVVNTLGGSTAIIVPDEEGDTTVPLPIQKLDAKTGAALTDRDSRFEVKGTGANADFTAVAFAENGYLVVANAEDPEGAGKLLRVPAAGTYTVTETKAPYGYTANTEPVTFTVDENGKITSPFKALYNSPIAYALGDFTWIDSNKNGVQDAGEPVLPGVKVTLLDGAGNVALDMDGNEVASVTTDANGRYVFDNLPVGQYNVRFELTDAQAKKYTFTQANVAGNDDRTDSDVTVSAENAKIGETGVFTLGKFGGSNDGKFTSAADYATELGLAEGTQAFKAAGGIDQTRDAGVVLKDSVSVGDYVWFDKNKDGQQGEQKDEPGIKGVVLTITGPDGKPVTDVFGDPVNPTTTDDKGYYTFENLPVLKAGESYTVTIDQKADSTKAALEGYQPTKETPGGDRSKDSSTWTATSEGLTEDGQRDPTLDFGFVVKDYAIGDFTWIDVDRDGVQDENEPVLPGVIVTLLDKDGNAIKGADDQDRIATTDANGFYLFDELPAGEYRVKFDYSQVKSEDLSWPGQSNLNPSQFVFTTAGEAKDGKNTDSDAARDTGISGVFTVGPVGDSNPGSKPVAEYAEERGITLRATDAVNPTIDAGIVFKNYAVGDYTWIDANRNGIQEDDEVVLPGVGVQLFVVVGGELKPAVDADGDPVATDQVTDKDGKYLFENLPAGEYQVKFTLTEEQAKTYRYTLVGKGTGADQDRNDSDARVENNDPKSATAFTETFTLDDTNPFREVEEGVNATQGIDRTRDAGVSAPTYAIGDVVWFDDDRDGKQDFDGENPEEPVKGVTVTLLDENGDPVKGVKPVVTGEDGKYFFDGLPEGKYKVKFELSPEDAKKYTFTTQEKDGVDGKEDSNAKPTTGITKEIVLGPNNQELITDPAKYPGLENMDATEGIDPTWDAGIVLKSYAVGDIAWIDTDRDGRQDFDGDKPEQILPGVKVEIFSVAEDGTQSPAKDMDGVEVAPVTTDENGRYLFDYLPAGSYQVKFTLTEEQSKKYTFTSYSPELGGADDSNADRATGLSPVFTLDENNTSVDRDYADQPFKATEGVDPTWDAGVVVKTYAIGDKVWYDDDRDGSQDPSEAPVPGVTVTLLDENGESATDVHGNPVTPVTTDENGNYRFEELPEGKYTVKFELPEDVAKGYSFTTKEAGSEDSKDDSDADRKTGITKVIELGDNNPNLTTEYEGLDPQKSTQGIDPTWDAGIVKKSYAIGDYTWIDLNQDGKQSKNEPVLSGVKVSLFETDGVTPAKDILGNELAPVFTDEFGKYVFDELAPGQYVVAFELTPEQAKRYSFTQLGEGSAKDSDAKVSENPAVAFTKTVTLDSSNTNLDRDYGVKASEGIDPTWDAGVIQKSVRVGDYVWVDTDKDGRQDKGEPGIPNVWLKIVDKDGKPVKDVYGNEVKPVKTDKNGKYIFENLPVLPEGEHYKVIIDRDKSKKALAKYKPTQSNAGNREGDSDEWESTTQGLNEGGDEDLTLDFGFVLADDGIDVGGVGQTRPASTDDGIDVGGVGQTRPADGDGMANTGLNPGWLIVGGAAVALMVIGGFLYAGTRRKPRRH
ncbi:SdrD B-like domain-containing protein [Galactobacter valiniphilus]|uniref:SdrD B-like domain-containing protein n=1 Tax=Galactobacter valiniphilus TaxID=2676122 RepID=UPI003735CA7E